MKRLGLSLLMVALLAGSAIADKPGTGYYVAAEGVGYSDWIFPGDVVEDRHRAGTALARAIEECEAVRDTVYPGEVTQEIYGEIIETRVFKTGGRRFSCTWKLLVLDWDIWR